MPFIRANEQIRFSPVMVIDDTGQNLGVMPTFQARSLASAKDLDLVEIDPHARPPGCKIMDFGKFKYDKAKKEKLARERQKETELKEIRLTAKIGVHDLEYKARQAREFFDRGHKVKVSMRLRGRENIFFNNALSVFENFGQKSGLNYERSPLRAGNQITAMVAGTRQTEPESSRKERQG